MRELNMQEVEQVSGGTNWMSYTFGAGSAITGVGAAALGAAAVLGAPELAAGAAVYGLTSAALGAGAALFNL